MNQPSSRPDISVVVLNYNGNAWMKPCLDSLARQTNFDRIEIIVTDNKSSDGSDQYAADWLRQNGKGQVVQNGANLMYCGANNNGAAVATGEFLLFLNNDTWLEPECLERLHRATMEAGADASSPKVRDYDDGTFQNCGSPGLDIFGLTTKTKEATTVGKIFSAPGCSLFIRTEMFRKIGGFAAELLIFADETDLCWRVWISGGSIVTVPDAVLHHRGAAAFNPKGATKAVESRTTDTKRFLANRNGILFLRKNFEHWWFRYLFLSFHLILLLIEAIISFAMVRRWSYIRRSYIEAISEAFSMTAHVREWRRRIVGFRRRSDFWILQHFFRLRPGRWDEVQRLWKFGTPKVDSR